jgi:hypothetical protein
MHFEREGKSKVVGVTPKRLLQELSRLRSEGPSSFASLTAPDGSYLQTAGGPFLFFVENRTINPPAHFRAWQSSPVVSFADGTLLSFSAGNVSLQKDEWFTKPQIFELFSSFLSGNALPPFVSWRLAPGFGA